MSQFFWETVQKARREHFCDSCHWHIQPGQRYRRWLWKPRVGVLHVMKEHEYPPCPSEEREPIDLAPVELLQAVVFVLKHEVVDVVYSDGSPGTETRVRAVPVTITVTDPPCGGRPVILEDDVPF